MPSGPYDLALLGARFTELTNITFVTAGGQKAVYSATHTKHSRVALKIFPHYSDPARAMREFQAVQKIDCPQVPRIFETGLLRTPHGDCVCLIEQWVDSESLRQRMTRGSVDDAVILQIARDTLHALAEGEKNHIVHRDVKPENILVNLSGTRCWLIDFGIARHLTLTSLTASGAQAPYTPGYAPPEQFHSIKNVVDGRADLFALGVTLFECVNGSNPFRDGAHDDGEILRRVQTIPLPPIPRDLDGHGKFRDLVAAMTRTRRSHRLQKVGDACEWVKTIRLP